MKSDIIIQSTFKLILSEADQTYSEFFSRGWGNGYVCLPNWHPFYKIRHDDIHQKALIIVHGGITFSALNTEDDTWVIGFDTNHGWENIDNCDYEYVLNQTKNLEEQCLKIDGVLRRIRLEKIKKLKNDKL